MAEPCSTEGHLKRLMKYIQEKKQRGRAQPDKAAGQQIARPSLALRREQAFFVGQIYFCGDTRPDARLVAFLQESGPVDLAFLQVACAVYFGKDDGLRLETAAGLARAFSPKAVVPMHFHGRFKVNVDPARLGALLAGSGIETLVIGPGEEKELAW